MASGVRRLECCGVVRIPVKVCRRVTTAVFVVAVVVDDDGVGAMYVDVGGWRTDVATPMRAETRRGAPEVGVDIGGR